SLDSSENDLNYLAQGKRHGFSFQLGRMCGLDRANKREQLAPALDEDGRELVPARRLSYDTLVIAIGSETNDFGADGAAEHCTFLDDRGQAEDFHQQLLGHYLRA